MSDTALPCPDTTPAAPAAAAEPRWVRLGLAAILLAALLAFLPTLRCEFVEWDDNEYVTANEDVAAPSLRILSPSTLVAGDWTPLPTLTYAAERAVFGPGPMPVHATNVLLHLVSVWLLYKLLREVGLGAGETLLACLLFAVHPLQVETVAWASARKNLLVCVAGFAFLRAHLAGRPGRATVWLVVACLAKGTAVAFPPIAAAATWFGFGVTPRRSRSLWIWVGAWMALVAVRGWMSASMQATVLERTGQFDLPARMATMGVVLATQARQIVAPSGFSILYTHSGRSFADPAVLLSWAIVAALAAAAVVAARRDRRLAFAAALAALAFLPTANVFPSPFFQQDRYLHVSLAGIAVLAVAALRPLARFHRAVPAAALSVWCLAVCVPATVLRIGAWRTDYDLWNDTCLKAPGEGVAWSHLGSVLSARGQTDDAIVALSRAASMPHPDAPRTIVNLAGALHEAGRRDEAQDVLARLLARRPDCGEAHALAGLLAEEAGDAATADRHFAEWLRLKPSWKRGHLLRGAALLHRGDAEGAAAEAAAAGPREDIRNTRALLGAAARVLAGQPDAGFAVARANYDPQYGDSLLWAAIGDKLFDASQLAAAEAAYTRAATADPNDALIRYRLAVARERRGDADGAREAARAAVERAAFEQARGASPPWVADARRLAQ